MFIKSTIVYSNVLDFHLHSRLTHPQQLPILEPPFNVSILYRYIIFYLLHHFYTVLLLCLDMFSYTVLTLLRLPTVFGTVTCCTDLQPRSNGYTMEARCVASYTIQWVHAKMSARRWNRLPMHFSDRIPLLSGEWL